MGQIKDDFKQWMEDNYPMSTAIINDGDVTLEDFGIFVEDFLTQKAAEIKRNTDNRKIRPISREEFERRIKALSKD